MTVEDIKNYLYHLLTEKGFAPGTVKTYNSGLRFLYNIVLEIPINLNKIPCHKKTRSFLDLLTRDEVNALFYVCDNLRDKCMLMLMYSAGLRLSEVSSPKVSDIDSKRMQLFIRNGKGGKDRFAIESKPRSSARILERVPAQRLALLQPKANGDLQVPERVQNIFRKYKELACITKKRHMSFPAALFCHPPA